LHKPEIARIAVAAATYWVDRPYDYRVPERLRDLVVPGTRVMVPFSRGNRRTEGIILSLTDKPADRELKTIDAVLDEAPVLSEELLKLALWMRERFFCTVYSAVKAMLPAGLWYSIRSVYSLSPGLDSESAYAAAGSSRQERLALDTVLAHGGSSPWQDLKTVFEPSDPGRALASLVKKGVLVTDALESRRVGDKHARMVKLAVSAEEALDIAVQKRGRAPQQASILELLCAVGRVSVRELCYFTGASARSVRALEAAGLLEGSEEELFRRPSYRMGERSELPVLNAGQQTAFHGICDLADGKNPRAALLFGVTGSGKTSIYIRLIDEMLRRKKSSVLLVPEIALTPQMLLTFSSHFGDEIAVLHSSLAIGERYDEWKRIKAGKARVVIGTRSAVFAPVRDLGLVIVDEEQEFSYKSENSPRYHARDVAKFRCAENDALLLLGSATPDVDSRFRAETGAYSFFTLPERYNEQSLPRVEIVDMKSELQRGNGGCISSVLYEELERNIQNGEQSILFLNRRGASKLITCSACGYTYTCPNCSVSLTWHSAVKKLLCHYCGHSRKAGEACPECGGKLNFIGVGTQGLEQELHALFPGVEVLRMDTDAVLPAGSHEALLTRFREKRIPIMVGTQMVTKGLDFENVTLVGVISADQSLYCGDYRASERTFSLLTQVVGRSGRGSRPGRAVIQTFTPKNQVIRQAARQDYESFYASEIELRRAQNSPPFSELYTLTASGAEEAAVLRCCVVMRDMLRKELGGREDIRVLGPAPLPVVRVNNRFRYRVTVSCRNGREVRRILSGILVSCSSAKEFRGLSIYADMDPSE
jgi:primosomal protein N' (replication factor Y)